MVEERTPRKNIPPKTQLEVWRRDNWHCRYCHCTIIYAPALKLLNKLNPGHIYFHSNGKMGEMLPLFIYSWASVDHIKPFAKKGYDNIENYVSACWQCNMKHGDKEVGQGKSAPKEIVESRWDGFYGLHQKLVLQKGKE